MDGVFIMVNFYFGLRWSRATINWGYQGKRGVLLGYKRSAKDGNINFSSYTGFYVLYNNDRAIYISNSWYENQKNNSYLIYDCLKRHTKQKKIWNYFSFIVKESTKAKIELVYLIDAMINYKLNHSIYNTKYVLTELFQHI